MAGSIEKALAWAKKKADGKATYNSSRPYAGYASYQGSVDKVNPSGESYVCASFVWYALTAGGFNVGNATAVVGNNDRWDTPGYLLYELKNHGWIYHQFNASEIKRGDVLIRIGHHTALATSNTKTVEAKNSFADSTKDISEGNVSDNPWDGYFRTTETLKWIEKVGSTSSAQTLNQSDMENNALCFYSEAKKYGWSDISIAGMLGCIEHESTINPGSRNLTEMKQGSGYGIGLIQWTNNPITSTTGRHANMVNWVNRRYGYWYNGTGQVAYLNEEAKTRKATPTISQLDFIPSDLRFTNCIDAFTCTDIRWTVEMATAWFLACFTAGYGGKSSQEYYDKYWEGWFPKRYESAQKWREFIMGAPEVDVGNRPSKRKKGMPLWMKAGIYLRNNKKSLNIT